jgi:hypothetical protein
MCCLAMTPRLLLLSTYTTTPIVPHSIMNFVSNQRTDSTSGYPKLILVQGRHR